MRLELRGLAWVGDELDEDVPEPRAAPLFLPFAIDAQDGARVDVENCWLSKVFQGSPACFWRCLYLCARPDD